MAALEELELDPHAVAFTVEGTPAQQGSKTFVPTAAGPRGRESNEAALKPWRQAVTAAGAEAMAGRPLLTGPLRLVVTFVFARPAGHYGTGKNAGQLKPSSPIYCAKRPDLDKLLRAIGDSLSGHVFRDDAQIVELVAHKVYGPPAAHVTITQLEPATSS